MEYPCNSDLEAKIKQEELIETQNLEGTSLSTRGRIQKEESKYSKCLEDSALGSKGTGRANAGDIAIGIATGESRVMETISGIISSADFASNSYDQESDKNMIRLSVHTGQPSTSSGGRRRKSKVTMSRNNSFGHGGKVTGFKRLKGKGNKDRPHVCSACRAAFARLDALKRHIQTHTPEKPFICRECGAAFVRAYRHKEHMRIHTGEKPFACKECGEAFSHSEKLKVHMMSHTGQIPYNCEVCFAPFKRASDLSRHMRTHTGEKPHKCSQCGAAFTQSSSLTAHIRIHTGERPFVCEFCGTAFTDASTCRQHRKLKHVLVKDKIASKQSI